MKANMGDLSVLYEDEWLLAVDKPAGILVHGDGTGAPTLTDLVRAHLEVRGRSDAASQVQPVQRLDVETTGVNLFSLDKETQPALDALVAGRADGRAGDPSTSLRKRYLAIVRGQFPAEKTLRDPIGRDRHDARRMIVSPNGKKAWTRATRLAVTGSRGRQMSLLGVEIGTGRRHQIRVHLASSGYPIIGDALYGVPADRRGNPGRQPLMLHAFEERLPHPVTGGPLVIRAPYPERFARLFPEEAVSLD